MCNELDISLNPATSHYTGHDNIPSVWDSVWDLLVIFVISNVTQIVLAQFFTKTIIF